MKQLCDLCNAFGPSGMENAVVEIAKKYINKKIHLNSNSLKSLFLNFPKKSNKPLVLVDGHSDELGLIVSSIKNNGLLKFRQLGGWNITSLPGQEFMILNSKKQLIKAVVGAIPPHFMDNGKRNIVEEEKLFLDIGATNREEVEKEFNIRLGAFAVPNVKSEIIKDKRIFGKAFDNRIGCSLVIDLCNKYFNKELPFTLAGMLNSQEENGNKGIAGSLNEFPQRPDFAIVFEGTPADDSWKCAEDIQGALDKGPQIRIMDKSMVTQPECLAFVLNIAEKYKIPYQLAVRKGGGTNAGILHSFGNTPTIVIGVPVRYAHTPQGIISIKDYEDSLKLAEKIIEELSVDDLTMFNNPV